MRKRVLTKVPRDTRECRVMQQWRASWLGEKSLGRCTLAAISETSGVPRLPLRAAIIRSLHLLMPSQMLRSPLFGAVSPDKTKLRIMRPERDFAIPNSSPRTTRSSRYPRYQIITQAPPRLTILPNIRNGLAMPVIPASLHPFSLISDVHRSDDNSEKLGNGSTP
jgi:hypothetical protein